jgi:predicted DNA-binding transcriptional regulator AlpA
MPNAVNTSQRLSKVVDDLRHQIAALRRSQDRSIAGFCARQSISRAHFYNLQKQGKAPRVAHVGSRRIITPEAERDWGREREAEATRARRANQRRRVAS